MNTTEMYGIVLADKDPLSQGRYRVNIPERMQRPDGKVVDGIWCQNGLSSFSGFRDSNNTPIISGNYRPIQPGTPVIVSINGDFTNPTIVRMAPTNITVPDGENRDGLFILEQTPDGSTIEMNSDTGYVAMTYKGGRGNVFLAEDTISLEINSTSENGSHFVSGIQVQPDKISLKMKDSMMELNSTGFSIRLQDGSFMTMTKKGIEIYGEDNIKLSSKKGISVLSSQVNVNGTSELHLLGSDTKISGTQKMAMNGNQINIESFLTTQLKGLHIGMDAKVKMTLNSLIYDNTVLGIKNDYSAVSVESAQTKSCVFSMLSEAASTRLQDSQVISNMGVGASVSASLSTSVLGTTKTTQAGLAAFGTTMLINSPFTAAAAATIALAIPGSAQPADAIIEPAFGSYDKADKKTAASVLNTNIQKRNTNLKQFSVVPDAMTGNARTLSYNFNV